MVGLAGSAYPNAGGAIALALGGVREPTHVHSSGGWKQ